MLIEENSKQEKDLNTSHTDHLLSCLVDKSHRLLKTTKGKLVHFDIKPPNVLETQEPINIIDRETSSILAPNQNLVTILNNMGTEALNYADDNVCISNNPTNITQTINAIENWCHNDT